MGESYRAFFGLQREPFCADISLKEVLVTPAINAVSDRIRYAIRLGAVALVTGEIGSGKSTALRYVMGNLHPAEYRILYVTATSGSILDCIVRLLVKWGLIFQRLKSHINQNNQAGNSRTVSW